MKEDNVITKGILPILTKFVDELEIPFEGYGRHVEELEFESRDGFIPYSHNRGGVDLFDMTDIGSLIGSGEHYHLNIRDMVDDRYNELYEEIAKEHTDTESDEFYNAVSDAAGNEYEGIAWRVRIMYNGDNKLTIFAGFDDEAPYFRWYRKCDFEKVIKFKNKTDLKQKLKAIKSKVEKSALRKKGK